MVQKITYRDYIKILDFYKIDIPKSRKLIQSEAEKILSEKLCICIKQIDKIHNYKKNESRSIAICTKSIFNKKGLTRGKFRCKNKRFITFRKTASQVKTRKNKN
jgi:hypothetical protein